MRTMLRAVVLWGVLVVGAGLASMEGGARGR
jgi:hypothetical protein